MLSIILFIVFVLILVYIFSRAAVPLKNWHHYFKGLQFSAMEFYAQVQAEIERQALPSVNFYKFETLEKGIFSAKREYLRVKRGDDIVDVGCATFGKEDSFVSWWYCEKEPGIISKIPVINSLFGQNPNQQSYYQQDTGIMFRSAVHSAILAIIDEIGNAKGYRALTELERQPIGGK